MIESSPAKENPVISDIMIIFFWTNPVKDSKDKGLSKCGVP